MNIFDRLQNNKGTVSSALSKEIAKEALNGNTKILSEVVDLILYDDKNVRSGASKILEVVAESNPVNVSPNLENLYLLLSCQSLKLVG